MFKITVLIRCFMRISLLLSFGLLILFSTSCNKNRELDYYNAVTEQVNISINCLNHINSIMVNPADSANFDELDSIQIVIGECQSVLNKLNTGADDSPEWWLCNKAISFVDYVHLSIMDDFKVIVEYHLRNDIDNIDEVNNKIRTKEEYLKNMFNNLQNDFQNEQLKYAEKYKFESEKN